MKKRLIKRLAAMFVCALFLAIPFLTAEVIIEHSDHDCEGHDCPICILIHEAENLLRQLSTAMMCMAITFGCLLVIIRCASMVYSLCHFTLVDMKVRMNN